MNIYIVLSIIWIHWIADFLCQTDWQAKNKSTNNDALSAHVFTYSVIWYLPTLVLACCTWNPYLLLFPIITFICHWITDYFTSRLNTKLWKEGKVHWFFVSIGFDQVLHYIQLFLTYKLLILHG